MHRSTGTWAGLLAVAFWAGTASAQTPTAPAPPFSIGAAKGANPACCTPQPQNCPTPSTPSLGAPIPSTPTTPTESAPPAETPTGTGSFRTLGMTNYVQANLAAAGSGTSATSAAAAATVAGVTTNTLSSALAQTPTILPGLLTAATVQSARPVDRVFFAYSYLDRFQVVAGGAPVFPTTPGTGVTFAPLTRQPGFNLNIYYIGVEKTFFDGMASAYVIAPFLQATNNLTSQAIDGAGNVSFGLKAVLLSDRESGSLLTGGMTASVPTGHNTTYVTQQIISGSFVGATFVPNPPAVFTSTTNPTYLQPWLAGLLVRDRFFVQEYLGVIFPTDNSVSTFVNNSVAVGYQVYRGQPGSVLSFVTPVVDVQALLPINHVGLTAAASTAAVTPTVFGTNSNNLSFTDQVFVTSGVQLGLGQRAMFSAGIITPVAGPKAFNWGVTVGLNLFY